MRSLLVAFATLCLLFSAPAPVYAADNNKTTGEQIADAASEAWNALKKGARDAWNATVKAFDSLMEGTKEIVLPAALPGSLSGKQLIGTPVENVQQKERVGRISDVVVGKDNFLDAFVVEDGGFLGIGADKVAVKPRLITVTRAPDGSLRARTNVTEGQIDNAADAAFVSRVEAMNESFKDPAVKSVSRLLSSRVVDGAGREVASVHDILLSPVGEARYAILSLKGPGTQTKLVSVMVSSLTFTRGGEPLRTSLSGEQLWRRAPVRY
jgi:hypothetical protein